MVWVAVSIIPRTPKSKKHINSDVLFIDGFFDAGMLLQALKASQEKESSSERVAGHRRRAVGKELRVSEY